MHQRDSYFDNAKFILTIFVVFGHLLNSYINQNDVIEALYKTIYSFHMPAFVLLSGLFAKGFYAKGYINKITKKLIIPYLIFQTIYTIYYYFLYNRSAFSINLFDPQWSLWFLLSLFCWYIMLLGFAKLKPLTVIGISIGIALLVGYIDSISNYLSLSRTFVFFPLFLIGYHMKRDRLKQLTKPSIRMTSIVLMLIVLVGFYVQPDINYKWLLGSKPYAELEDPTMISMFKRLGFYSLSLIMVFSFLSLMPLGRYFFTNWGKQSLYVYLLHGFIIKFFRESELRSFFVDIESFVILAVFSFMLTIILSSKLVASFAQPIIELKLSRFKQLTKNAQDWWAKHHHESPIH